MLAWRLGEMDFARVYRESYVWIFSAPGDQVSRGDDARGAIPPSDQQREL
jgi:hypothetical protein